LVREISSSLSNTKNELNGSINQGLNEINDKIKAGNSSINNLIIRNENEYNEVINKMQKIETVIQNSDLIINQTQSIAYSNSQTMKSIENHQKEIRIKQESNEEEMKQNQGKILLEFAEVKDGVKNTTSTVAELKKDIERAKNIAERNEHNIENMSQRYDEMLINRNEIEKSMENVQNEQNEYREILNTITTLDQILINKTEEARNETMRELETMKRNNDEMK
jgi:chromosome segregation ATPase